MSDIQWHSWTAEDMEPSSTGIWARRSEVEAALAAKDAEIGRILSALIGMYKDGALDGCFTCGPEGLTGSQQLIYDFMLPSLDALANAGWPALETTPHPDSDRLDKLPRCFHMLRYRDGKWHLTYDDHRQFSSVRDAIDAHQEPKP